MKTIKFLLSLSVFAMLFTACTKEPDAAFKISTNPASVGETIEFTNTTVDGDRYEWDFGDGTTATTANASYQYSQEGNYSVTLTAYSKKDKKKNTTTQSLKVVDTKLRVRVYDWEYDVYLQNMNVSLYNNINDWLAMVDVVSEKKTDAAGYALFTQLNTQQYYVNVFGYDSYGDWFDNWNGDAQDVLTPTLTFGELTDIEVWVDYDPDLKRYNIVKIKVINKK